MLRKWLFLLLWAVTLPMMAQKHPHLLFHISKSANRNIVCYEAVLDGKTLNLKDPVHPFWHNNEERPGAENDLSFIQKRFAYGYKALSVSPTEAVIALKAYDKRSITLRRHEGRWKAFIFLNGKECQLVEIYVKSKPGHSTSVEYIILKGLLNGKEVQEKVLNR